MRMGWIALTPVVLLVAGCAMHSKAYDDAFAACQAEAVGKQDTYEGNPDQRDAWLQDQTNQCMKSKGFEGM
jgi:hypothetical protein